MALKFVKGDILDVKHGIIGHQVNCQMVMGAGLAKQIREKYSKAYEEYMEVMGGMPENLRLGRCQMVEIVQNVLYVANIFGQYHYAPSNIVHTDYNSLAMALRNLNRWRMTFFGDSFPVYLPKGLGCGLAKGNWETVKGIISVTVPDSIIVRYEKNDK
jgi:O-acetyl-ADP-ribose deacetylase (regulator of RNase III)